MTKPTQTAPATKPPRVKTVFDLAKVARQKLDTLDAKRQAIIDELPEAARVLLEALDEHHAQQPIEEVPSDPVAKAAE